MKGWFALAAAAAVVLASGAAPAEVLEQPQRFMAETPKETVYASEYHMVFSWRAALIDWLGGIPIVKETERLAGQRENWWGDAVPLLPAQGVAQQAR